SAGRPRAAHAVRGRVAEDADRVAADLDRRLGDEVDLVAAGDAGVAERVQRGRAGAAAAHLVPVAVGALGGGDLRLAERLHEVLRPVPFGAPLAPPVAAIAVAAHAAARRGGRAGRGGRAADAGRVRVAEQADGVAAHVDRDLHQAVDLVAGE